jgi:hypothetical protein
MYMLNVYGPDAKAIKITGDTTNISLAFTGLDLELTVDGGFPDPLTWLWAITRLV